MSDVEIQEQRDALTAVTRLGPGLPQDATRPESQLGTTAPGSAQRRAMGRRWLFTAWVQLLV